MSDNDPDLRAAYALETPEDSKRLYADWAESYDESFAQDMDYRMPQVIAQIHAEVGQDVGPILDVGAGTGLFVQGMPLPAGVAIDALDISVEMLEVAAKRGVYREFLQCDLSKALPISDATYGAVVSAGTFTHGHVGPEALDELMRVAKPGAMFVLGINAEHYVSHGFEAKFAALKPHMLDLEMRIVPIYGSGADAAHREDKARVVVFRKR